MGPVHLGKSREFHKGKRGSGSRLIVKSTTPTPKNWHSFLLVDENKTELYNYCQTAYQFNIHLRKGIGVITHRKGY